MHIAVCDDNVADRKQLERLLKRESDRRTATTGVLYTDSFGNASALLANPMQYDAFYIDMCHTEGISGMDVVSGLTAQGVNAPIIMCCSDTNYRQLDFPSNVIFLDKPIKADELTASIDHALEIKSHALPLIELREESCTLYVTEPDIAYAVEDGRIVYVHLTDGRIIEASTSAMNLFTQLDNHPSFFAPSKKIIINGRYISKLGFHKAIMMDGTVFKIPRVCMEYAKYAFENFRE